MRGEKSSSMMPVQLSAGSPPHTRGKACDSSRNVRPFGITPAYAGKSKRFSVGGVQMEGSPPHTRGKADNAVLDPAERRITPAYAGKAVSYGA